MFLVVKGRIYRFVCLDKTFEDIVILCESSVSYLSYQINGQSPFIVISFKN